MIVFLSASALSFMTAASSSSCHAGFSLKRSRTDAYMATQHISRLPFHPLSTCPEADWAKRSIPITICYDAASCGPFLKIFSASAAAIHLHGRHTQLPLLAAGGDDQRHRPQERLPLQLPRRLQLSVLLREGFQCRGNLHKRHIITGYK